MTNSGSAALPDFEGLAMAPAARPGPSAASWLASANERLDELANLGPGWDGGVAPAIDRSCIETVSRFVSTNLIAGLPVKPQLVPTVGGGLLIEWHTQGIDLIIESSPCEDASYYYHDAETDDEVEGPLGADIQVIAPALRKLGSPI
jgi:hypothetical protein